MATLSQSEQHDDLAAGAGEAIEASKAPGRLAWVIVALTAGLSGSALSLSLAFAITTGDTGNLLSHQSAAPLAAIAYGVLGALVVSHRPKNPIGWMFLAVGLLESLSSFAAAYHIYGVILWGGKPYPGDAFAKWLNSWLWVPALFLPTTFVLLLFPDGKLPSRRWRPVAWVAALALAAVVASLAFHPGPVESWGRGPNPLGIGSAPVWEGVLNLATILLIAAMAGSIAALVARFRRSRGIEREQIKWLVYGGMLMVLGFTLTGVIWFGFADSPLASELSMTLSSLSVMTIAVAASLAIARHHLYDIDLIINRTLVYAALTAVIVTLYVLIVGGVGAVLRTQSKWLVALVATGVVAVLFQPLRQRLQKWVNRLLYGQRDEPFEVLADLGQRLEATLSPEMVYPTLVETVAQTLKLPYAAISVRGEDGQFTVPVSYGKPVPDPIIYPLTYQGETIGRLEIAPRARGESLSEADQRLLRNIARQAGTAVHAVQLTGDLQRSRRQLVTAREEERRRLRRDLHDGLGPSLAALHVQSGVLRRLIKSDPDAAEALLDEFRGDIRATIDEIRRVVYELRPPALDELGLAAAVRSQAGRWSTVGEQSDGSQDGYQVGDSEPEEDSTMPLQMVVEAPETFPPLPAAVEVAAYRIIQEALANVAHHAQASCCVVRLTLDNGETAGAMVDPSLRVEIIDDGQGLNGRGRESSGLGLLSMRERAEELGGTCIISSLPDGGTRVRAILPVS